MRTLVNLLVDKETRSSHILRNDGKRTCHCRVSKSAEVEDGVDISVPHPERNYNVCEESWKHLRKELDKFAKWNTAATERKSK